MTQQQYWKEVSSLAKSASLPPSKLLDEHGTEDPYDFLHQEVERQVIYTHDCLSIMTHTDSPDAYWEMMGEGGPEADSWSSMVCTLAFYAMMEDITQGSDFDPQEDEDEDEWDEDDE